MADVLRALALLCAASALLCAVLALLRARDVRVAVGVLLDLLLAAGLLRLAASADATALATAAALVLVRRVAGSGLRSAAAVASRGPAR